MTDLYSEQFLFLTKIYRSLLPLLHSVLLQTYQTQFRFLLRYAAKPQILQEHYTKYKD